VNDVLNNVEVYVCSGANVLKKLTDQKLDKCEYDNENNIIYYTNYIDDYTYWNDLYYVTIDGNSVSEGKEYAADAFIPEGNFLGDAVIHFKGDEDSFIGNLYIDNKLIDQNIDILSVHRNNATSSYSYKSVNSDGTSTMKLYQDGTITAIADQVSWYYFFDDNKLAYIAGSSSKAPGGQLYLYDGSGQSQLIDTEVAVIIPPLENEYCSYWDNRPPYEIE
jgi:hypothetical protein